MNEVLHPTKLIALNAAEGGVPDWINVIPAGSGVSGIDGRQWTMTDANAVIDTFRRRGNRLPVDIEHSTQLKGGVGEPAPAVGFVTDLESRDTGLWARVEWNAAGEDLMKARSYAHCSPVFAYDAQRDIKRLVSVGLTNNPNLDLVALNRAMPQKEEETPSMDKAIAEALGLAQNASSADAVVAINKLRESEQTAKNSAQQPDPAKFVPKADYDQAMNKVSAYETAAAAQQGKEIEAAVDAEIEAGKIAPASRDYHVAACKASENGLESFKAAFKDAPAIVDGAKSGDKTALNTAQKPGAHGLSQDELAICRATGVTAEQFAEQKKKEA